MKTPATSAKPTASGAVAPPSARSSLATDMMLKHEDEGNEDLDDERLAYAGGLCRVGRRELRVGPSVAAERDPRWRTRRAWHRSCAPA